MKYYVTSDVHGFYTSLREALANAGYFDDDVPHKLLIAGDLFDRGGEATALQDFILDLMDQDAVILIRGNHEDLYEELVGISIVIRMKPLSQTSCFVKFRKSGSADPEILTRCLP